MTIMTMMTLCFLVWILGVHACAAASSTSQQKVVKEKNIFILAGQSNMAGRGGVVVHNATGGMTWDGLVPAECQPSASILRFTANFTWEEAREPLHAGIDTKKANGIGPGMPFAHELLAKDSSSYGIIGLVPCAVGGTKIDEWAKGTHLYNELVRRARTSLVDGGTIRGFLWYQGESDTNTVHDANTYQPKLQQLFEDVRFDLMSPMLPIIQVLLDFAFIDLIT